MADFTIRPPAASTFAGEVDALYAVLWALTILFSVLVGGVIFYLAIRYRRGNKVDRSRPVGDHALLELTWSIIPLILGLAIFAWGARLYAQMYQQPPAGAREVTVIGKQWMWHLQHSNGTRENNELHLPVGEPVKLTMISQDVIHCFYVPAFRLKRDVVPGRYTNFWFTPTKPGKYRLFCTEYCGTQHSLMGGWIYVMPRADFQEWLSSGGNRMTAAKQTLASAGAELYQQLGCYTCHGAANQRKGPTLVGIYGKPRKLQNGQTVIADETYLRESILYPNQKLQVGWPPLMANYADQLSEEQVMQLIAYIKTLSNQPGQSDGKPNRSIDRQNGPQAPDTAGTQSGMNAAGSGNQQQDFMQNRSAPAMEGGPSAANSGNQQSDFMQNRN